MEKGLSYIYDDTNNELNIILGETSDAIGVETDDEVYVQIDPGTKEVRGFTILHFQERFKKLKEIRPYHLPLSGHFELSKRVRQPVSVG